MTPRGSSTAPARTALATPTDAALDALDRLRAGWLRLLARLLGPGIFRDRDLRILLGASVSALVALSLAAAAPLLLLALGPLILGVPHLLADLRYLGARVRPRIHPLAAAAAAALLAAAVLAQSATAGALAILAAAGGARAPLTARAAACTAAAALLAAIALAPIPALLALTHGHNLVAVALWWRWSPSRSTARRATLAILALAPLLPLTGALDATAISALLSPGLGVDPSRLFDWLAPGLPHPWDVRLVLSFAIAQSLHYTIWLRLIPEEDRPRAAPVPFRSTWQRARRDFGRLLLPAAALFAVLLAIATVDLDRARDLYLGAAIFHGFLELAAVAVLAITGGLATGAFPAVARPGDPRP